MKFVFWQNMISMHQIPFMEELAKSHDIELLVETEIDSERRNQGWEVPNLKHLNSSIFKENEIVNKLMENADAIHIFSGIKGYKLVHRAFRNSVKLKLCIVLMAEPQNWMGLGGILRFLKSKLFFLPSLLMNPTASTSLAKATSIFPRLRSSIILSGCE